MVFSSISFIFFILPLFLLLDSLGRIFFSPAIRNAFLLLVSLLFYTWGESTTVLILVAYGVVNYFGGRIIRRTEKNWVFGLFLAFDLFGLFFYKYSFWLAGLALEYVFTPWFGYAGAVPTGPSLPLGISFFTFQAMSYIIDVHRRKIPAAASLRDFMAYLCMFSQLVAGPIVRYETVADMLTKRGPDRELFSYGVYRFLIGLNKKVLIANSVAPLADAVFLGAASAGNIGMADAWFGVAAYAVQIYFDFSGYSDMAIGLGAMGGFRFNENFLHPYHAKSITDFWRRWHVSLSTWFRDYLYIPLGGNRHGKMRTVSNKMIVFILCGLWHGADVTFLLWGAWHGLLLLWEGLLFDGKKAARPGALGQIYALLAVLLGWVLFRAETIGEAGRYFAALVSPGAPSLAGFAEFPIAFIGLAVGGILSVLPTIRLFRATTSENPDDYSLAAFAAHAFLATLAVGMLFTGSRNPFIYFNF